MATPENSRQGKYQNTKGIIMGKGELIFPFTTTIKILSPYLQPHTATLRLTAAFPVLLLKSRRELRAGSALDGKLPAGNHRQFRCYCPLEPLRKVCILAVLTEGQRFRVTVSGNRFLAEFRRATEYRMTPTDRNTPFGPLESKRGRAVATCFSLSFPSLRKTSPSRSVPGKLFARKRSST